jgi:hypothetical protein
MTTGLDPAMTLGCGGWGGNITSDNISPKHLLNIKRLAYETQPAKGTVTSDTTSPFPTAGPAGPRPQRAGLNPDVLGPRIDQFLASRGIVGSDPSTRAGAASRTVPTYSDPGTVRGSDPGTAARVRAAEFVCEEDVRRAVLSGVKIVLDSRTIVTPAARDLGEEKRVFVDSR